MATTWDPTNKGINVTLSFGNLTGATSNHDGSVLSTTSKSSGKFYFEVTINQPLTVDVGVADASFVLDGSAIPGFSDSNSAGYYGNNNLVGELIAHSDATFINATATTTNDVVGVAVDVTNHRIYWSLNGTWQNSANPASGTGSVDYITTSPIFAVLSLYGSPNASATANFGNTAFNTSPPSGFSSWDSAGITANLTGVNATGSAGTITITSTDANQGVAGVVGAGAVGSISIARSINLAITGNAATGSAGNLLVGNVYQGSLAVTDAPDTVAMAAAVTLTGFMIVTDTPDTADMAGHYGLLGWIPANLDTQVWTNL